MTDDFLKNSIPETTDDPMDDSVDSNSAYHYKQKLSHKQLKYANLILNNISPTEAFKQSYGEDKAGNTYYVSRNVNVMGYIKAKMLEKETTLDSVFEQTIKRLEEKMNAAQTNLEFIQAAKLIHDTKVRLEEIKNKYSPSPKSESTQTTLPISINITPYEKPNQE